MCPPLSRARWSPKGYPLTIWKFHLESHLLLHKVINTTQPPFLPIFSSQDPGCASQQLKSLLWEHLYKPASSALGKWSQAVSYEKAMTVLFSVYKHKYVQVYVHMCVPGVEARGQMKV